MSTAISKTVRISLAIVALLIVGLLVAPFFIDVNTYKTQIEQQVEDATGRQLTIGSISASLFPWIGVELEDVHFANRPGFAERDFASVKHLEVSLALLPLLSKQVEIQHFEIDTPDIYLERHSDGETNWGDLAGSKSASTTPKATSDADKTTTGNTANADANPLLAALQAESLGMASANITWVDGDSKPVTLSELNVLLKDVQLERPVSIAVSGKLSGNAFELEAMVGPLGDLAKIDPMSLPVQGRMKANHIQLAAFKSMISSWPEQLGNIDHASIGFNANIEQRPNGVRTGEGQVALVSAINVGLDWKMEMPDPDRINLNRATLNINSKNLMQLKGKVSKLSSDPTFDLQLDGQPLERTWLAAFVPDLNRMYNNHPSPWKQIKLASRISGNANKIEFNDMQLMLDQELLQASGAVAFAGPDIRLRISGKQLHLDPWLPQANENQKAAKGKPGNTAGTAAGGKKQAAKDKSAEPDLRFLKPWKVAAKMNVGTMHMRGLRMDQFNVNINGAKGLFNLKPLNFRIAGGSVTENATLNAARFPAHWSESVHIKNVKAGPLLKTLANVEMLEGTLNLNTNMRGGGLTPAAVKTLNGKGKVDMRDGKLKGLAITSIMQGLCGAGDIRSMLTGGNPLAMLGGAEQKKQDLDFAQLTGSFNIKRGVVNNQDLFMASPFLRMTGKGTVNLVNNTLAYEVKPRVVGSCKGQTDNSNRTGIAATLLLTGPLEAPKYKIKNIEWGKGGLKSLGGSVGGTLGKMLGGKGANQPAKGTRKPAGQQQQQNPEQKLLKGLGGAFGL